MHNQYVGILNLPQETAFVLENLLLLQFLFGQLKFQLATKTAVALLKTFQVFLKCITEIFPRTVPERFIVANVFLFVNPTRLYVLSVRI